MFPQRETLLCVKVLLCVTAPSEADEKLLCLTVVLTVDVLETDGADNAPERDDRNDANLTPLNDGSATVAPPEAASISASVSVTSPFMHGGLDFFSDIVPSSPFHAGL